MDIKKIKKAEQDIKNALGVIMESIREVHKDDYLSVDFAITSSTDFNGVVKDFEIDKSCYISFRNSTASKIYNKSENVLGDILEMISNTPNGGDKVSNLLGASIEHND